jgi:hypothetical protein
VLTTTTTKYHLQQLEENEKKGQETKERQAMQELQYLRAHPPSGSSPSSSNRRREQRLKERRHQQHKDDRKEQRKQAVAAAFARYDNGIALQARDGDVAQATAKGEGRRRGGTIESHVNRRSMLAFAAAFFEFLRLLGPDHSAVGAALSNMLRVLELQVSGERGLSQAMRRYEEVLRSTIAKTAYIDHSRGSHHHAEAGASFCAMQDVHREHSVAVTCAQCYKAACDEMLQVAGPEHSTCLQVQQTGEMVNETKRQLQAAALVFDLAYQEAITESHRHFLPFTRVYA